MNIPSPKRPPLANAILFALVLSLLSSCGAFRPATVPMRSVVIHDGGSGHCLAVLLPGRYASPESFAQAGFGEAVATRGLDLDVVAVDAHLGYYRARTVIDRLREDVVLPARARGYEEIWIAGASLGGLGGILYLRDHPDDLAGVLAIAPFLGDEEVIREIEAAGGPLRWKPPAKLEPTDAGREVWSWLATGKIASEQVPFTLGWGTSDRFDRSNRLLASLLPEQRTLTVPGAHDLETWNRVWVRFLEESRPCRRSS